MLLAYATCKHIRKQTAFVEIKKNVPSETKKEEKRSNERNMKTDKVCEIQ